MHGLTEGREYTMVLHCVVSRAIIVQDRMDLLAQSPG